MSENKDASASLERNETRNHTVLNDTYRLYINAMVKQENEFVNSCNTSMDSTLVFAGLFSAILSALVVETRKSLLPDPHDRVTLLLEALYNQGAGAASNINAAPFEPPPWAIAVNLVFFVALSCSLLAGLGGLLVKQWARQSASDPRNPAPTRDEARAHHAMWSGLSRWNVGLVIATIPMLLHVALLLFLFGISWWLKEANDIVFGVTLYFIAGAVILYVGMGVAAAVHHDAPFKWPFTSALLAVAPLFRWTRMLVLGMCNRKANARDTGTGCEDLESNPLKTKETSFNGSKWIQKYNQEPHVSSIDRLSLRLLDRVDEDIFSTILENSVSRDELTSVLGHLYQTAAFGSIEVQAISPRLVRLTIDRCDELAGRCCDFSDEGSIHDRMRLASIENARICCQSLDWILTSGGTLITPKVTHPQKALRLLRVLRDTAIRDRTIEDLVMTSVAMCHLQDAFYLTDPTFRLDDLLCPDGIMLLFEVAPDLDTPAWKEIDKFQELVTEYVWAITESLMSYARHDNSITQTANIVGSSGPPNETATRHNRGLIVEFPSSTPTLVIQAWVAMRKLLGTTDRGPRNNYGVLTNRLASLVERQGASGWAFVWLKGILGPLRKGPMLVNGTYEVVTIPEADPAFDTYLRD